MQPTPPIYPDFKLKNTPSYVQQLSTNNISPCKPVAIISHGADVTLITCSKSVVTEGALPLCQHNEYESHSTMPLSSLIQDLQQQGYSVYSKDEESAPLYDHLPEFNCDELAEEMDTSDTASVVTPQDLEAHDFDPVKIIQLLPPEAANPLMSIEQDASTSRSRLQPLPLAQTGLLTSILTQPVQTSPGVSAQTTSEINTTLSQEGRLTSAATLSQTPSANAQTSQQTLSLTALLNQRSNRVEVAPELDQPLRGNLNSLMYSQKLKIYCMLDILENNYSRSLTKIECIDLIKHKYANFDSEISNGGFDHGFAKAINLGLVKKFGHQTALGGFRYQLGEKGCSTIKYLKSIVYPTLKAALPIPNNPE